MRKLVTVLLCFLLGATQLMAQSKTITGKVTDEKDGTPIAGVSVTVTGATGTVTTADGTFRIVVPASAKTIEFSYVGFATQRLNIADAMTVALKREDANLDEVVVVAYGTAKKETLTGSIGQIKSADYAKRPLSNVTAAIEGAVPGVVTTTANGQPGSGISIRVRGFGSINATS